MDFFLKIIFFGQVPVKGLLLVLEFLASENVLCSLELCFKGFLKVSV